MNRADLVFPVIFAVLPLTCIGRAQTASSPAPAHTETTQDLVAKLTPDQKQQFDNASKAFAEHRYADSLALHQALLKSLPCDPILLKFSSEDALDSGDAESALKTLKPLVQADSDDWQAAAMLAHACAETGDKPCRDAQMAHLLDLHTRGTVPARMQQYPVERVKLGENTLLIKVSLVPWGTYNVYALGQLTDKSGKLLMSITLESDDFDQPAFAKDHPGQSSKGVHRFSFDSYTETGVDNKGNRTQSQALYEFIDGQPSYDTIREKFLKIASGQAATVGARNNLKVP